MAAGINWKDRIPPCGNARCKVQAKTEGAEDGERERKATERRVDCYAG